MMIHFWMDIRLMRCNSSASKLVASFGDGAGASQHYITPEAGGQEYYSESTIFFHSRKFEPSPSRQTRLSKCLTLDSNVETI
ncbi:hypothetical protein V9T40_004493 [Parthenolecanium corni]|uniref:Uncharacterized protein n=1 Tax=Parthenolecanium corni TaxID=536013 RepID=A0AAN9YB22_9HEMI